MAALHHKPMYVFRGALVRLRFLVALVLALAVLSAATPVSAVAAASVSPAAMRSVPSDCTQVVIITGAKLGSRRGNLEIYNKIEGRWVRKMRTNAYFGAKGLVDGMKRKQGRLQTPTGIWRMGSFVFGMGKNAPGGTLMPYRRITKNAWWSAKKGRTYNTWVYSSKHIAGEHLINIKPQYDFAVNTGYNSLPNQRVYGRGTAIFIHCNEPPGNRLGPYTHGCIAISRTQMKKLFSLLDSKRNPACAIGALRRGDKTSIWAY